MSKFEQKFQLINKDKVEAEVPQLPKVNIKVIGVGGGGGNAVRHMMQKGLQNVELIAANTDMQVLAETGAHVQLQLGANVTGGLGAGANPEVGRQAALEDQERIRDVLQGAHMVFITAGMGGGTGTGAAPVVAKLAKEMDILTVAVVTKPFLCDGDRKMQIALQGIDDLAEHVDSLLVIPNEKLLTVLDADIDEDTAYAEIDEVLYRAVQGVVDLIYRPGRENVDFADVKTVMNEMGLAIIGTGIARGDDRAQAAMDAAIRNPLLDEINLRDAKGILVYVTSSKPITMAEKAEIGRMTKEIAAKGATIIHGRAIDPELQEGEIRVTVVATGLSANVQQRGVVGSEFAGSEPVQRGGSQLRVVPTSVQNDVITGLPIDKVSVASFINPAKGLAEALRRPGTGHMMADPSSAGGVSRGVNFGDPEDFDIPAMTRRQAD